MYVYPRRKYKIIRNFTTQPCQNTSAFLWSGYEFQVRCLFIQMGNLSPFGKQSSTKRDGTGSTTVEILNVSRNGRCFLICKSQSDRVTLLLLPNKGSKISYPATPTLSSLIHRGLVYDPLHCFVPEFQVLHFETQSTSRVKRCKDSWRIQFYEFISLVGWRLSRD